MDNSKDYNQSINLYGLKNVAIATDKSSGVVKKGLFIPIEENDLFVSLDENLKVKKVLLNLTNWGLKTEGKYGDTHITKQAFSQEFREQMTEEELRNMPILGNMKPIKKATPTIESEIEVMPIEPDSEMPF